MKLDISKFPIIDSLRLIRTANIGPVTFFELLGLYKSPEAVLQAIPELAAKGGKKNFKVQSVQDAENEIENLEKENAKIIPFGAPEYSSLLSAIYDPPPLLFVKGHPTFMRGKTFAVVGSRNASANGRMFTRKISSELGGSGFTVVSGLARGVDTEAHQAAITTGTIGVIAGGIDNIYPPENKKLFEAMAESGLIISEQPIGSQPTPTTFPRRNRIISGLSHGTLVVEASLRSGSLITAHMAREQRRQVFAVPGSPLDERCKGCNKLIKQGAVVTEGISDIISSLRLDKDYSLSSPPQGEFEFAENVQQSENEMEAARREIIDALSATPVSLDEIHALCNIPLASIRSVLLELELAGRVQRLPGSRFALLYKEAAA